MRYCVIVCLDRPQQILRQYDFRGDAIDVSGSSIVVVAVDRLVLHVNSHTNAPANAGTFIIVGGGGATAVPMLI
jgi:dihydroxyacetone kinase-like predicted kinase